MWEEAEKFLKKDKYIGHLVKKHGPCDIKKKPKSKYFEQFVREIAGQQLSGKAASTIFGRVKERMGGKITPEKVIRLRKTTLRACGLSNAKSAYIKDLAKHVKNGELEIKRLDDLTDEKVMAFIEAETDGPLKDSVMPFTPGASGVLADLSLSAEQVRSDVREVVGFSRVAQGEFQGKTHVSAEETKKVFQSLNIRLDERRDMMADLLTNILRRFNQIVFTQWDQERVSRVVGPDGAQWWLRYTGQQIKDEYDLKVTPEEGPNLDTAAKFDLGIKAAEVWATLNQGAIAQGAAVPAEIQRLIFNQFQGSGLDIDRLLAQSQAASSQAQTALQGLGQSQGSAVSPGLAAQAIQQTGGGA